MTDTKISAMPSASPLSGTELFVAVQSGNDVSVTPAQVVAYGSITGIPPVDTVALTYFGGQ